jgi:hypothetical protein
MLAPLVVDMAERTDREGDGRLYGYRIERAPRDRERGAVAFAGGWFEFSLERPAGWTDDAEHE